MARTTVTVDDELIDNAKDNGINVSQVTRKALRQTLNTPDYHIFNTNERHLPGNQTGTVVYGHGIVATFAKENKPDDIDEYGGHIARITSGDRILSYENDQGIRAVGLALEDGNSDPIPDEHRLFHPASGNIHEFHAPVYWVAVLDRTDAVTVDEINQIVGRPVWAGTHTALNEDDHPELLWDVVVGRSSTQ